MGVTNSASSVQQPEFHNCKECGSFNAGQLCHGGISPTEDLPGSLLAMSMSASAVAAVAVVVAVTVRFAEHCEKSSCRGRGQTEAAQAVLVVEVDHGDYARFNRHLVHAAVRIVRARRATGPLLRFAEDQDLHPLRLPQIDRFLPYSAPDTAPG